MNFREKWMCISACAWLTVMAGGGPAAAQYLDEEKIAAVEQEKRFSLFGTGSFEFGQIVKGQYTFAENSDGKLDHYWMQQALARVGLVTQRKNGFGITIAGEGVLSFPYSLSSDRKNFGYELLGPRFRFLPYHTEGSFLIGEEKRPLFYAGAGFFPYKYNPDGTNFGDYLFRVNPYPQYFPARFDTPYRHLLGLRLSTCPLPSLTIDGMLTSEVYLWPLRDFSLSLLVDYRYIDVVDIGLGAVGHRLISVDERLTTPPSDMQEPAGGNFSFRGTKLMARLAVSPMAMIRENDFFGKNDFKVYSEFCLNGVKNYPVTDSANPNFPGYNDRTRRMLVLYGLNWPTHPLLSYTLIPGWAAFYINNNEFRGPAIISGCAGLVAGTGLWLIERFLAKDVRLDRFSIEAEWWDNDFANSYWGAYPLGESDKRNPNPWKIDNGLFHTDPYGGPWHWSVYMKKTIYDRFKLILQFSRDHTVLETTLTGPANGDPQEAMDGRANWMWMGKLEYSFDL